jgi:2-amino-4-hydroxy-6-hydroxymethyldihydropteridine diphosphokinase
MTETPNPHAINADTLTGEMHPIRRAVLAIGSNLGERFLSLQGAVNSLADTPDVWVTSVSAVYETVPVESPEDAKDFLNAVVLIDTTLSSRTLLERCLAIESAFGRERDPSVHNAPRTLDVDLIVVGDRRINDPDFVLPTPGQESGRSCCSPGMTLSQTPNSPVSGRSRACWRPLIAPE